MVAHPFFLTPDSTLSHLQDTTTLDAPFVFTRSACGLVSAKRILILLVFLARVLTHFHFHSSFLGAPGRTWFSEYESVEYSSMGVCNPIPSLFFAAKFIRPGAKKLVAPFCTGDYFESWPLRTSTTR